MSSCQLCISLSLAKLICSCISNYSYSYSCSCSCICSLISRDINFCQICAELIRLPACQIASHTKQWVGRGGGSRGCRSRGSSWAGPEAELKLLKVATKSTNDVAASCSVVAVVADDDDWHLGTAPQLPTPPLPLLPLPALTLLLRPCCACCNPY